MAIGRIPEPGTGIPESIIAAKGDLIVGTANDTPGILTVGTNGHTLVADSSTATGLAYAVPAAPSSNFTLVNAGGTTLSGTNSTTISGITDANELFVVLINMRTTSSLSTRFIRFNGDSGSNYGFAVIRIDADATPVFGYDGAASGQTSIPLTRSSNNVASRSTGYFSLSGGNTAGVKTIQYAAGSDAGGGSDAILQTGGGLYYGTGVITSVTIEASVGNFNLGTIFVFKA